MQAEYDPELALWLPNRRKFFLMGLAAGVAAFLPHTPRPEPETTFFGWPVHPMTIEYIPQQIGVSGAEIIGAYYGGKPLKAKWPIKLIGNPTFYVDSDMNFTVSFDHPERSADPLDALSIGQDHAHGPLPSPKSPRG